MLIEQIIEFQLREPGPLARMCTTAGYFHDKKKSLRKIFESNIIYCENIAGGNVPYLPYLGRITYNI